MDDPYQPIIDSLLRAKRVLVTTHVRPDGDALGTAAAMVLGMRKMNIDSQVLLLSHLPSKYSFIFADNAIAHHDAEMVGRRLWTFQVRCPARRRYRHLVAASRLARAGLPTGTCPSWWSIII